MPRTETHGRLRVCYTNGYRCPCCLYIFTQERVITYGEALYLAGYLLEGSEEDETFLDFMDTNQGEEVAQISFLAHAERQPALYLQKTWPQDRLNRYRSHRWIGWVGQERFDVTRDQGPDQPPARHL